jgi:hypothetical protein
MVVLAQLEHGDGQFMAGRRGRKLRLVQGDVRDRSRSIRRTDVHAYEVRRARNQDRNAGPLLRVEE